MKGFRKHWPWLLLVIIPLWMVGAAGELMDARLLEKEGVTVEGTITSAKWVHSGKRGTRLICQVSWMLGGREYGKEFALPKPLGAAHADEDGHLIQPLIEVRCARSKPEVASLVALPPDPVWVSVLIASVGLCVVSGVVWFLIKNGFWAKR